MASGGPTDPNVVLIDFVADRIELWSSMHGVAPVPPDQRSLGGGGQPGARWLAASPDAAAAVSLRHVRIQTIAGNQALLRALLRRKALRAAGAATRVSTPGAAVLDGWGGTARRAPPASVRQASLAPGVGETRVDVRRKPDS
jgi:hypothetical protein